MRKYLSIKIKIFIPVTILFVLFLAITYIFLIRLTERNCNRIMRQEHITLARTIERSLSYAMSLGKKDQILPILKNIKKDSSIHSISITNLKGEVLKTTDQELKHFHITKNFTAGFHLVNHKSFYRSYNAIENKAECHRCHGSRNKIIGVLISDISTKNILEYKAQIMHNFLATSFLILLPTLVIILIIINASIVKPINIMQKTMQEVKSGNLHATIAYRSNDELGDLISGFNEMTEKLETLYKEVELLYSKEIQKAGQIALVGELAAGLAHEIKNPLAGISGALEVLKDDLSDFTTKQVLSEVLNEIGRINRILNDLLQYTKPKDLEIVKINMKELISQSVVLAQNQVFGKEVSFVYQAVEDCYVKADPFRLQQVFLNLFLNCIQAIKTKGIIEIEEKVKNTYVEIQIKDNGEGIPEDKLSMVFKPFFTTKPKGTGLGLSISKQIIEQHGGSIWIESKQGEGSIFSITLPLWKIQDEIKNINN